MLEPEDQIVRRGVVAVIVREGRMLVIRRSQTVLAPGKICFPGGGIETGESEETALVRELQEELGTVGRPVRRLWQFVNSWHVELTWWLVELDAGADLIPNPLEVESILWHTPAELAQLPELLEGNHEFLERLAAGDFADLAALCE